MSLGRLMRLALHEKVEQMISLERCKGKRLKRTQASERARASYDSISSTNTGSGAVCDHKASPDRLWVRAAERSTSQRSR